MLGLGIVRLEVRKGSVLEVLTVLTERTLGVKKNYRIVMS